MEEAKYREFALHALREQFTLTQKDLGSDAVLSAKGMTFTTESWEIGSIGNLCVLRMKAPLGVMRMETVIISPTHVDMPLFNIDWVKAFGTETQFAELYDTQLQPWPAECENLFEGLLQRDADLPDAPGNGAHWYDSILYPCSYHKKGKKLAKRFEAAAHDYLIAYVDQLAGAASCDEQAKADKVRSFATRLFDEGGPAVDQVANLFGKEAPSASSCTTCTG